MKKGQVSMLLIIGAIILIGSLFALIVSNNAKSGTLTDADLSKNPTTIDSFKGFVDNCIDEVSNDAISYVGLTGGYKIEKTDFINYYGYNIPIYLTDSMLDIPTLNELELSMSKYFNENIGACIEDINSTGLITYEINGDDVESEFDIVEESVIVETNLNVKLSDGSKTTTYKDFRDEHNSDFYKLYNLVNEYLDIQMEDENYVLNSRITQFAKEKGIKIELINYDSDIIIYSFISSEYESSLIYNFVIRYHWLEVEI